jgi:hypothetical protein
MQQISSYFYPNLVTVQCNPDPSVTARWRIMYQRQVKLYKGVDNLIQIRFLNGDQKPVNVTGWLIFFNVLSDEEGLLLLTKNSNPNGGITIVNALQGIITVSLTEFDLLNLDLPYYNYALTVIDPLTGIEQVIYIDENYESRGEILLRDGPYPEFQPSIEVDLPSNSNSSIISSAISSDDRAIQQSAHHTSQFYFTNFTGNIYIQGTLDSLAWINNTNPDLSWGNVKILESGNANVITVGNVSSILQYTNQSSTDYCDFDGVYVAIRFIVSPTNGNVNPSPVTQILYRA